MPNDPTIDPARRECARFIDAFGVRGGDWFIEGLTFEQAKDRHYQLLEEEKSRLRR